MTLSTPGREHSFAEQYALMSDSELVAFAASYDSLTDPAQSAMRAEFARRHLEPPTIEDHGMVDQAASRGLVTIRRYRDLSEAIVCP